MLGYSGQEFQNYSVIMKNKEKSEKGGGRKRERTRQGTIILTCNKEMVVYSESGRNTLNIF